MNKMLNLGTRNSCLFLPFFVCLQDTQDRPHTPKCMVSCHSGSSCFPLSAYGSPLFTRCMISCHLAPAPLSLLLPSYLPAITVSQTLGLKTNLLSHTLYMAEMISLPRGSKGCLRVGGAVFLPGGSGRESSRFILVEK